MLSWWLAEPFPVTKLDKFYTKNDRKRQVELVRSLWCSSALLQSKEVSEEAKKLKCNLKSSSEWDQISQEHIDEWPNLFTLEGSGLYPTDYVSKKHALTPPWYDGSRLSATAEEPVFSGPDASITFSKVQNSDTAQAEIGAMGKNIREELEVPGSRIIVKFEQ